MPVLLAFGDSNTYGTAPQRTAEERNRFARPDRWPGACADALGPDWEVVEEGLPGRTAQFADPVMGAHMEGGIGLRIALESHGPIDHLAILLGTNDVKSRFARDAAHVAAGVAGLADMALSVEMQARHGGFAVLLIAPPRVVEVGPFIGEFTGSAASSAGLPDAYRVQAEARGIGFFDANDVIAVSPVDGIHFDAPSHRALGRAIAGVLRAT